MGDFRHGVILIDLEHPPADVNISVIISQLLTSTFITQDLDTQIAVPLTANAYAALFEICGDFRTDLLVLSKSWLPTTTRNSSFKIEKDAWMACEAGASSLASLGWLKKRVERIEATKSFSKSNQKVPWLFSLLTLGRRRGRNEPLIHPLDQMRAKR